LESPQIEFNEQSEVQSESFIKPKRGADGKFRLPLGEHKPYKEENLTEDNEMDITCTHQMIVLKCENLVIEAKILSESNNQDEIKDFCQTFNPTEQSKLSDYFDEDIPINETTKNFVFKLLKNSVENFYQKVRSKREEIEREEEQNNKIAEYENELRILKDWNQFVLVNSMDNYEHAVV
jgi:hypothetical protein